MRADIEWLRVRDVRAMTDAKYKTHTLTDDLHQILAYCPVLGLRGHVDSDVEISRHVLDLDRQPSVLLDDIDALVDNVAGSHGMADVAVRASTRRRRSFSGSWPREWPVAAARARCTDGRS
jgi:hypothetical protein